MQPTDTTTGIDVRGGDELDTAKPASGAHENGDAAKPLSGAEYIAECLKQAGVEKVFGQCGHTNYALIDACHRIGMEYVSFRHEQQAAHAADAYFRVSHKLAVVNVHLSPGLTNALTGVASAAADSTPMVVICGNTPSYHHAREPHQGIRFHADASQGDIYRPICKRVWRVDDAKFLPDVMPRALNMAQEGRPGAVLIDVPMDVFSASVHAPVGAAASRQPTHGRPGAEAAGVAEAATLLRAAKRPVLFAGNGVHLSRAWDEVREIAELLDIPVATTLIGKGAFPDSHPLALGTTGIWGTRLANDTTRQADVVLAVGTGFGEAECSSWNPNFTFAIPPSKLIQIDSDPQEIGKIYPVEVGLLGDAKSTLRALIDEIRADLPHGQSSPARRQDLATRREAWLKEIAPSQEEASKPIHPARLLKAVANAAPKTAVFVTDVGWNKNGAGQQLPVDVPQSFITSGGLATMGFAPAAAIGAKIGAPDRKVICLVGDGGFVSVLGALTTAVELGIPVLWVLFNNFCFSTIRTVGTRYFQNTYATEFRTPDGQLYNPDFMLLAKSFGIESALVTEPNDLDAALATAIAVDSPYLLEVRTRGDVPMPRTGHWDIADFLE
jgi:acetolactate synthase I/II/III large subunit